MSVKNEIVILTATSGDTGKAAMAGFADVEGTRIIVFYPKNGVSKVQELQMRTQKGANVDVVAIHGNFDNAQSGVKQMFEDQELAKELADKGYQFSSANSINIGRHHTFLPDGNKRMPVEKACYHIKELLLILSCLKLLAQRPYFLANLHDCVIFTF